MADLINAEFLKMRTIRSPWVLLAVQQLLLVAAVAAFAVSGQDVHAPNAVRQLLSHGGVVALFALILGINAVAGEYRHRTITDAYLATPRRERVIAAKLVAYTITGTGFGILAATTSLAATAVVLAAKDAPLEISSADVWRTLAGTVAWNALYAAIGVSAGALVTNLTGAVAAALVWITLVEGILRDLLGDLGRWLPLSAARALEYMPAGDLLPQWGGGLVLVVYAVLFAVAATAATVRRDVT